MAATSQHAARYCSRCGRPTGAAHCPDDGAPTFAKDGNSSAALHFAPGQIVDGKYRMQQRLGRGGFGAVYAAEHLTTGQHVAIKVLAIDPEDNDDSQIQRFLREAQVTARLRHPNTVRVFDFGQTEHGALFMVLELLNGPTLEKVLRQNENTGTTMAELTAIGIALPILRSLTEAHDAGLVHRDLKPLNVILADSGDDEPVVKVLDFGIARKRESDLTGAGKALGTPAYMSPEQCRGAPLDGRSDLYALAVILFRCVTGRLPFPADNQLALIQAHIHTPPPDVRELAQRPLSSAFVEILQRALAKKAVDRFESARAMRLALESVAGHAWGATPLHGLMARLADRPADASATAVPRPAGVVDDGNDDGVSPTDLLDEIGDTRVVDTRSVARLARQEKKNGTRELGRDDVGEWHRPHDVALGTSDPAEPAGAVELPASPLPAVRPVLVLGVAALIAAVVTAWALVERGPTCGNSRCEPGEDGASCVSDCPSPTPAAGPVAVEPAAAAVVVSTRAQGPVALPPGDDADDTRTAAPSAVVLDASPLPADPPPRKIRVEATVQRTPSPPTTAAPEKRRRAGVKGDRHGSASHPPSSGGVIGLE